MVPCHLQEALPRALLKVGELPLALGLGGLDSAARDSQLLARYCCPRVHFGLEHLDLLLEGGAALHLVRQKRVAVHHLG